MLFKLFLGAACMWATIAVATGKPEIYILAGLIYIASAIASLREEE